jgi:hypothetical protein
MLDEFENLKIINMFTETLCFEKDPVGTVRFRAKVIIETSLNKFTDTRDITITLNEFDRAGRLYIDIGRKENEIDVYLYPTDFIARYQKFEFIEGVMLKISGEHKQNPKIGKYTVKIIPELKRK